MTTVRTARPDDVDAIAALSALHRRRLSEWAPTWWRMADGSDDLHPLWLGHLVTADGPVARVAVDDQGAVRAAAIAHDQGRTWFVDDVVADDHAAGVAVLAAVTERPALTCIAAADDASAARAREAGWAVVSSYWIGPTDDGGAGPASDERAGSAERTEHAGPAGLPATPPTGTLPPHTFGVALATGRAGGVSAPPVYDPGGTATLLAAVPGPDRSAGLGAELAAARQRGDAVLALVVASDDAELATVAPAHGLTRTVDVWSAPPNR